ncbi:MAG: zinc-dependent metalloprotease [Flavisolibacter sp.]
MKRSSFILLFFLLGTISVSAQTSRTTVPPKTDSTRAAIPAYNGIVTASTRTRKGLFTIHQNNDKYYFEIPDSLLGRQLLFTTWLVKVPGGSPKFGGEVIGNKVISFERDRSGKIDLKIITILSESDSTNAISKAVRNSSVDAIAFSFDIKARGPENKSSVIDVNDLLQKENMLTTINPDIKGTMALGVMAQDRSFVKSFSAYPINVEIKMTRTYAAGNAPKIPGRPAGAPLEAAKLAGTVTLEMSASILLMPEKPMMARRFDARVGYFAGYYNEFSDEQQKVDPKVFIVRYRLEPKPEDIEKYKRGELVEPGNPIVYYVDPATPKQWRPYIIAGINDWNEAFKSAGFKNAIIGKEWPENDTTMSLEDARYKVIRYFPSEVANAYGPHINDPRSGEVLQSYVGWYHNVMSLIHDWYMIQAGPSDPRARQMKFSDSLMGQLIRFVSSHEVGHTLGLRHNMGSSSLTPVDSLRSKTWVEAHGHTNSIMDYARFNYVAQPEDSIGEAGLMPRINDYDKWAIKWGYTWTGAKNDEEDRKIVSQWIVDSLKANPRLWFGGEGLNFDARSQSEDLGDDNMKANSYGIRNLKYVMKHLPEWTKTENDFYANNLQNMYRQVVTQYQRYVLQVANNIGSIYETWKTVEQPGNIYAPEPKAKQKEAVAFLQKEVFTTPGWLLDNNILNKLSSPVRMGSVGAVQTRALDMILNDRVLNSLQKEEDRFGKDSAYTLMEYLNDLRNGIWSELGTHQSIDIFRRNVQKNYINNLFASIKEAEEGKNFLAMLSGMPEEQFPITVGSDIGSYLALHLQNLRKEILKSLPLFTDKDSRDHLKYVADQISSGLEKRFDIIIK